MSTIKPAYLIGASPNFTAIGELLTGDTVEGVVNLLDFAGDDVFVGTGVGTAASLPITTGTFLANDGTLGAKDVTTVLGMLGVSAGAEVNPADVSAAQAIDLLDTTTYLWTPERVGLAVTNQLTLLNTHLVDATQHRLIDDVSTPTITTLWSSSKANVEIDARIATHAAITTAMLDLSDTAGSPTAGDFQVYNGTFWTPSTLTLAGISDVGAPADAQTLVYSTTSSIWSPTDFKFTSLGDVGSFNDAEIVQYTAGTGTFAGISATALFALVGIEVATVADFYNSADVQITAGVSQVVDLDTTRTAHASVDTLPAYVQVNVAGPAVLDFKVVTTTLSALSIGVRVHLELNSGSGFVEMPATSLYMEHTTGFASNQSCSMTLRPTLASGDQIRLVVTHNNGTGSLRVVGSQCSLSLSVN